MPKTWSIRKGDSANLILSNQLKGDKEMNKSVVFIIILLVIVLSIIVSQYFHKRHHEYKMADIEKAIRGAYPKGIGSISKEELVTAVKKYFHCSAKEAHYIIGVARRKKLVDIAADYVTIMF
jgi:uncharacterized membrane protein